MFLLCSVARAATLTVTTTSDLTADDGSCSLREALASARDDAASGATAGECPAGDSGSDTISLPAGTYTPSSTLAIDSVVSLEGAGADTTILYGTVNQRMFSVSADFAVSGLTFTHAGNAVFRDTSALTAVAVTDCDFTDNQGGVFYQTRCGTTGAFTVTGSSFSRNQTSSNGAAIYTCLPLTVTDSTFTDSLTTVSGGAVYHSGGGTFRDTVFSSNTSTDHGGAIRSTGAGELVVERVAFVGNLSSGEGGAVHADGHALFRNVTFDGNIAGDGSAVAGDATSSQVVLDHSTVTDNVSRWGLSGALYQLLDLTVSNSIVADNVGNAEPNCDTQSVSGTTTSLGHNVLGDTWACATDDTDVLVADPLLGSLSADDMPTLEPQAGSAARELSDCVDTDGAALSDDARGEGRPAVSCTAGAHQVLECGDGLLTPDEACDDGGTGDGDGCSSTCTVESGWSCSGSTTSTCTHDDWNDVDGDGWIGVLEGLCGTDPYDATQHPRRQRRRRRLRPDRHLLRRQRHRRHRR
ncbi:MAG: hypothetical protein H6738_17025 [Alphaproteobacteria bacterium]|nr:hypothetical protein [Alphaproteobacteria bacterium]